MYSIFFSEKNPVSTIHGYYNILSNLPENSNILDVGCGDGIYFTSDKVINLIKDKQFNITCIDIDNGALNICNDRLIKAALSNLVKCSNTDFNDISQKYDYVLFMESFPVIPMVMFSDFIKHAISITNNEILMYHNLTHSENKFLSIIKPKIKYLTMIDFGRLTTIKEMDDFLNENISNLFDINLNISCKYSDISYLNIPFFKDEVIEQYLIQIYIDKF
tara:strand:+ start:1958 stop:2614 length:657 start_codon:yes stop_codon:yes gene_type:complete